MACSKRITRSGIFQGAILILTVGLFLAASAGAAFAGNPPLSSAPTNPEFSKYYQDKLMGRITAVTPEGHPLGLIPPPFELPKVPTSRGLAPVITALPATFDLRTSGGVTDVRNQGGCGSCWAFASFASFESYLKYKLTQSWDFSEEDLNEYHLWDSRVCEGGNHLMSTAYLARWAGPVNESDVPYPWAMSTPGVGVKKHVQKVWFLPDRSGSTDNSIVKQAVQSYGAVYATFQWNSSYYNATYHSYYKGSSGSSNHAVAIVGWDDAYSKAKFNTPPPGNGAFIMKNSWGTGWGENGYFYMSYYDASLWIGVMFCNAGSTANYARVYEYDPLGWTNSLGFGSNVGWFANLFKASSSAPKIKGVSFYTPAPNCPYELRIYDNVTAGQPRTGTLVKSLTGTISKGGYSTIDFGASPATVTPGKKFSVVVKLTVPPQYDYDYPIPVEGSIEGYSSGANAYGGQSFVSGDGTSWSDLTSLWSSRANVCLKAFGVIP
jgi:C1A family cysteine protease